MTDINVMILSNKHLENDYRNECLFFKKQIQLTRGRREAVKIMRN